jgi:hypothetical protein
MDGSRDTIANLGEIDARASLAYYASHIADDRGRPLLNELDSVGHAPVTGLIAMTALRTTISPGSALGKGASRTTDDASGLSR